MRGLFTNENKINFSKSLTIPREETNSKIMADFLDVIALHMCLVMHKSELIVTMVT